MGTAAQSRSRYPGRICRKCATMSDRTLSVPLLVRLSRRVRRLSVKLTGAPYLAILVLCAEVFTTGAGVAQSVVF